MDKPKGNDVINQFSPGWLRFQIPEDQKQNFLDWGYYSSPLQDSKGKKLGNNEPDLMVEGNPYELKAFKGNNIIHIARTKIDPKSENANVDHAKWAIDKMQNLILFKFQETYDNNPKKGSKSLLAA